MTDELVDADRENAVDDPGDSVDATSALADAAARAVESGGDYLRERFAEGTTDAEYTDSDVKTAADREAERRVLSVVRERYPGHRITAEESGDHPGDGEGGVGGEGDDDGDDGDDADYRWWVDALDGTNNFAVGIPTFGVAATACDDRGPVATAVHVPMLDDVYVARRGGGIRYNGEPVSVTDGDRVPPSKATVGMIIGPPVVSGGPEMRTWKAITDAVDGVCKRPIQTWAPVVYWGLFARGRLDGFVCFHPATREQVAGELLAREAGAVERSEGPLTVFGTDEETCDVLWDAAAGVLHE